MSLGFKRLIMPGLESRLPTHSLTSQSINPNIPPYCSDLQPIQTQVQLHIHNRLKYKGSAFCPHNTFMHSVLV